MLTITLDNSTVVDYTQFRVAGDQAEFLGPNATDINTDSVFLKSIAPKRGNNQYGNRRSSFNKVTGTPVVDLEGNPVVRNRKIELSASLPVGTTLTDLQLDLESIANKIKEPGFAETFFLKGIIEY
jgi:hypothetical protein